MKDGAKAVILLGGIGAGIASIFAFTKKAEALPENVMLSNLQMPTEVYIGETVVISLIAENIGGEQATREIVLEVL